MVKVAALDTLQARSLVSVEILNSKKANYQVLRSIKVVKREILMEFSIHIISGVTYRDSNCYSNSYTYY